VTTEAEAGARPGRRVRVVAALISEGDRVLIQQRPMGTDRGGLWEFPGGKAEGSEGEAQALARECREELGVEIAVGARVFETEHDYSDLTVSLALYRCQLTAGRPVAREGQKVEWAERARLQTYPFCEADLPVLEPIVSGRV
jgi:8-oxo-dGTP diphosphatase